MVHGGSQPKTLVRKAKRLRKDEERLSGKYDRFYCFFSRDEHPSFMSANGEAESNGSFLEIRAAELCNSQDLRCVAKRGARSGGGLIFSMSG